MTARRFTCPACGRFIGTTDGTMLDAVPCPCGWQTVVKLVGRIDKAPSPNVDKPGGRALASRT